MRNFYISDLHLGHANIILYDNRPFKSIDEMDEKLIENWNAVVTDEDVVYHIGDFSWDKYDKWVDQIRRLNGRIFLIKGNHDRENYLNQLLNDRRVKDKVIGWENYKEISDAGKMVVMSHYYMTSHNGMFRGSKHLYGHVHCSFDYKVCLKMQETIESLYRIKPAAYNVGCMVPYMSYTPRTLDEIEAGYDALNRQQLVWTRLQGIQNVDVKLLNLVKEETPDEDQIQGS